MYENQGCFSYIKNCLEKRLRMRIVPPEKHCKKGVAMLQ